MISLDILKQNWQDINWTVKEISDTAMYLRSGRWELWINEDMFSTNGNIDRKVYKLIGKTMDFLKGDKK